MSGNSPTGKRPEVVGNRAVERNNTGKLVGKLQGEPNRCCAAATVSREKNTMIGNVAPHFGKGDTIENALLRFPDAFVRFRPIVFGFDSVTCENLLATVKGIRRQFLGFRLVDSSNALRSNCNVIAHT